MKAREEELNKLKEDFAKEEKLRKELEEQNVKLLKEKNEIFTKLQSERDNVSNFEDRVQKLVLQKADLESHLKELEEKISEEEAQNSDLNAKKKKWKLK